MALRVWLLVDWVDEGNVLPSYGIVNVDTLAYNDSDLYPGNEIFLRVNREGPRRAKILRISESKRCVQEHREMLERQDQQVKNVLQICMQTIRDVKSQNNTLSCGIQHNMPSTSSQVGVSSGPAVINASNADIDSDSASDSDEGPTRRLERSVIQGLCRSSKPQYPKYGRKAPKIQPVRGVLNTAQTIRSTPHPITLVVNQATQTDPVTSELTFSQIEEIEASLKRLYKRFQQLVAQVNRKYGGKHGIVHITDASKLSEHSSSESDNDSCVERSNNDAVEEKSEPAVAQNNAEPAVENIRESSSNSSNLKADDSPNPNVLKVRRVSAHTTNNVEAPADDADLVPIGDGNTKVPARLLNDINWNSHSMATRQLLQAVFPRRILATHCLTGKQSPAFMNRPPKKILDPKLVEDIVKIVSTRCGVPKSLVRNSITIKCTDEAKLYKNRMQHKLQRRHLQMNANDENIPPPAPSSDDVPNPVMN